MASHRDPRAVYRDLVTHWTGERHRLNLKKNRIGWGRLASVVLALTGLFTLWSPGWYLAIGAFTLGMAAFLRLVARDVKVSADLHQAELMLAINQEELRILDHQFADREDGSRWMETDHPYAADLDILGRSSLYQVLNRTTSEQGGAQLARWLLHPADGREILHRQEAIGELSPLTEWRQKFQAAGMSVRMTTGTQQRLEHWIQQEDPFTRRPAWHWIRWVEPAVMGLLVAGYLASVIPGPLFWGLAFLFFLLTGSFSRRITTLYTQLGRVAPELATLSRSAHLMETPGFRSPMLRDLQQPFMVSGQRASVAIGELKSILDRFDLRQNPAVFFILNTLLFWDLQQVIRLESWKTRYRPLLSRWFENLGQLEALHSLATLQFNAPDWCIPQLSDTPGTLVTRSLGHPLIDPAKRVVNDFSTRGLGQISLVTGSNMAGKSTFLRSVGVNVVLASLGGPVCAGYFAFIPVRVCSSMRISDNLEESTSTFYAELKKLKYIITQVNQRQPVLILLDEMLRGTNSADRRTGSGALLRQLIRQDAVAIVATHDLELAALADPYPGQLHNYHFDVQVAGEELYFDYRLRPGICQSMNASLLMKKIGIEL